MDEQLKEYLLTTLPSNDHWVKKLKIKAEENNIPIMEPLSINLLLQIIRIKKPKKILEIGTAIGYSALRMHTAYPSSQIITIERDPTCYEQAIHNIQEQNKQDNIQVIYGDAREKLTEIHANKHKFDLIFIDAVKSHYKRFFELSNPLLNNSGIILTDNVLFKGYVAKPNIENSRLNKLAEKIRNFNKWLVSHPEYITTIIPIGDGVAISYKKDV